jgi:hypothetical protein
MLNPFLVLTERFICVRKGLEGDPKGLISEYLGRGQYQVQNQRKNISAESANLYFPAGRRSYANLPFISVSLNGILMGKMLRHSKLKLLYINFIFIIRYYKLDVYP